MVLVAAGIDDLFADHSRCIGTSVDDGLTWAARDTPLDGGLMEDVIFDTAHSQFVAVGASPAWVTGTADTNFVMTSPDGGLWTERTTGAENGGNSRGLSAVAAGNGLIVAVGFSSPGESPGTPVSVVSADGGATWTVNPLPLPGGTTSTAVLDIDFGGGQFLMSYQLGGVVANTVWSSTDGVAWAGVSFFTSLKLVARVVSADDQWQLGGKDNAVTGQPPTMWTSPDASAWTTHQAANLDTLDGSTTVVQSWHFDSTSGLWIAQVTGTEVSPQQRIVTTPDFSTWTNRFDGDAGNATLYADGVYTGTSWILVAAVVGSAFGILPSIIRSTDHGVTWAGISSFFDSAPAPASEDGVYAIAFSPAPSVAPLWWVNTVKFP